MKIWKFVGVLVLCSVFFALGYLQNNDDPESIGNIEDFGALSIEDEPGYDSRPAIQKAIDDGVKTLYIPKGKIYEIGIDSNTYEGKGTGIGLDLKSNMRIYGGGTLRAKDNIGGSFTLIGNSSDSIKNVVIEDITVDGNVKNAKSGATRSNIVLFGSENSRISGVESINAPYVSIMIRGGSSNIIQNNLVDNSGYIGIQIHKQFGSSIEGNKVYNSKDNAIDVEGNDTAFDEGEGSKITISKNVTDNSKTGIFLESAGKTIVSDNHIYNTTHGAVYINRINSGSFYNTIANNQFVNETHKSEYTGIIVSNSSGKTQIHHNVIKGYKYGVKTNLNSNQLTIDNNYFSEITEYLIYPESDKNSLVKSQIGLNFLEEKQVNGFPKTVPSTSDGRMFNVSVTPARSLETNKSLQEN